MPSRHGDTLNSRRAVSLLVRLVEREEMWEAPDHQNVLSRIWGGTEQNRTVTSMVLTAKANNKRKNAMVNFVGLDLMLLSIRSALFHTTGSTTTERPSIKTDSPLLYEMTSLLRTSASPPMSPHQSSCSNHTAKESTAPREPQKTLKTLYYFTQDSKRTHD
ncbi:hypothetical protein TNCV_4695011 [Trichonephila clavipes]|nr:hypothetical protein TNCV_4695011 [Trichonephila clavipes]